MKLYTREPAAPTLSISIPTTPRKFRDSERGLEYWEKRILVLLSSPSRSVFNSWAKGTQTVLAGDDIKDIEYETLLARVQTQQKARTRSHRSLQKGGQLTTHEARHKIAEKHAKERAKEEAKKQRSWAKIVRADKIELHKRGVAARKAERMRKKEVLRLQKANLAVPHDLLDAIRDPEKQAEQAGQTTQAKIDQDDGFIRFEDTDSEDEVDTDHDIEIGLF